MKTCNICGEQKDISQYNINRYYKGEPKYRNYCKDCQAKKDKEIYKSRKKLSYVKPEKTCPMCGLKQSSKMFNKALGSSTGCVTYCKSCQKIKDSQYKSTPRYKKHRRENALYRYYIEKKLTRTLTDYQWKQCLIYFKHSCAYCGSAFSSDNPVTHEHFIPVYDGGNFTSENIIPACKSCNSSKSNKNFYQWAKEKSIPQITIDKIYHYLKTTPSQICC